ncbi:hypothetical protein I551_7948 [Mycobacterium ulcerans str. Harvey]|uniref:Uncharacterized protein n=1 Tax=Mycobacterium ulcerans str. Harvey TaxID=1299332 RepID=A0ABN0QLN0_MYCUL|nr:hypothetical protein I551_7948 [Mycobacterium ulcerans str. Harvey]
MTANRRLDSSIHNSQLTSLLINNAGARPWWAMREDKQFLDRLGSV